MTWEIFMYSTGTQKAQKMLNNGNSISSQSLSQFHKRLIEALLRQIEKQIQVILLW